MNQARWRAGFGAYGWQIPAAVRDYLLGAGHWQDCATMNQLAPEAARRLGDHAQMGWHTGRSG